MGALMNAQVQAWMPAILALFGSLIVVVLAAWINTRMLSAQIEAVRSEIGALRAEMRQGFAELELRLTKQIMELDHRIERLEEQRGLIRTP
jgi:septal ring factor EnvC (AmiA/AmiB activator)